MSPKMASGASSGKEAFSTQVGRTHSAAAAVTTTTTTAATTTTATSTITSVGLLAMAMQISEAPYSPWPNNSPSYWRAESITTTATT